MLHSKVGGFLHPRARVVKKQQERAIAQGVSTVLGQRSHERRNLLAVHESRIRQRRPFRRYARHAFADVEHLRYLSSDVLKPGT